jgi:sec-independent protein translocase protein TatC
MPFMEHLEELRKRVIRCVLAVLAGIAAAYPFKEFLYNLLSQPLKDALPAEASLIYTAPAEAFFTLLKVAILAGIIAASPVIFYQMWRFIAPGLYSRERRRVWPFVTVSSLLFLGGAAFCYAIVFPYAFLFFMQAGQGVATPMISIREYFSFSAMLLFAFGFIFQMPLVLVFLGRIGVVSSKMLRKKRKYAILIMFIAAAVFTPPDPQSQIMMALPMLALFEISLWVVALTEKKKQAREAESQSD